MESVYMVFRHKMRTGAEADGVIGRPNRRKPVVTTNNSTRLSADVIRLERRVLESRENRFVTALRGVRQ